MSDIKNTLSIQPKRDDMEAVDKWLMHKMYTRLALEKHGVSNVVGNTSLQIKELRLIKEFICGEDGQRDKDLMFAYEILQAVEQAVDLSYNDTHSTKAARRAQLAILMSNLARIEIL